MQLGRTTPVWSAAALVLVFFLLYATAWDQWFFSDDFPNLVRTKDRGLIGGFFDDLLLDESSVYWRPGWYLMFGIVQKMFGANSYAFVGVALLMHVSLALLVMFATRAICHSTLLGFAGGVLFISSPAYCEAVMWPSAALNVLPCAILLFLATRFYLLFVYSSEQRYFAWSLSLFVASLLFKEAGYSFPIIALAAHAFLGPRKATRQEWLRNVLRVSVFGVVIVAHYFGFNRIDAFTHTPTGTIVGAFRHLTQNFEALFGIALGTVGTWIVLAPFLGIMWYLSSRRARFLLAWSIAAMFPYAVLDAAPRFLYFCHAPWAMFFAVFVADLQEHVFPRIPLWAAGGILLVAASANAVTLPAGIDRYVQKGKICQQALAWAKENELWRYPKLYTERLPSALDNGLSWMLRLHMNARTRIEDLGVDRRFPHFLIHEKEELRVTDETDRFVRYTKEDGFSITDKDGFLEGRIPVSSFFLVRSYEVEPKLDVLAAKILQREVDLNETVMLLQEPVFPEVGTPAYAPTQDRILSKRWLSRYKAQFELEVTAPSFLVLSVPQQIVNNPKAFLGGKPTEILPANGIFHAVAIPPGRHTVTFTLL